MTGGDAVYRALRLLGVEHVFGIVSVHNAPIYDALLRGGEIEVVAVRHEQAAVHAADAYARASGSTWGNFAPIQVNLSGCGGSLFTKMHYP